MQVMHVAARGKVPQHAGLELSCAAAGVVKSPLMRVQEPFAALLNRLTPYAKLVPRLAPDSICVSEEAVRFAYLGLLDCGIPREDWEGGAGREGGNSGVEIVRGCYNVRTRVCVCAC